MSVGFNNSSPKLTNLFHSSKFLSNTAVMKQTRINRWQPGAKLKWGMPPLRLAKKGRRLDVELSADEGQRHDIGEYTVVVRSGSTAYISSGYDVPYPERWARLSHKHGHIQRPVTFKKVDTGYDVRPVLMGNNVQIEITPHISYIDPRGLRQPIRFAEAPRA